MSRATTKKDLARDAMASYDALHALILQLSDKELSAQFDFSSNTSKKEAHWSRDRNVRDVLIHLYEWHMLLLKWIRANASGKKYSFIPQPYNWRTYGEMNIALWEKHQTTSLEQAKLLLDHSHSEIIQLVETFSDEDLFTKGTFEWVGSSTLGSYFVSTTASHYSWAIKKIKAHKKIMTNSKTLS